MTRDRAAFGALVLVTLAATAAFAAYALRSLEAHHLGNAAAGLVIAGAGAWCTPTFARAWARAGHEAGQR